MSFVIKQIYFKEGSLLPEKCTKPREVRSYHPASLNYCVIFSIFCLLILQCPTDTLKLPMKESKQPNIIKEVSRPAQDEVLSLVDSKRMIMDDFDSGGFDKLAETIQHLQQIASNISTSEFKFPYSLN